MDTAVIVIHESQAHAIQEYLTRMLPTQSAPWVIEVAGIPAVFVNIVPASEADLEPQDRVELQHRLHSEQLLAVLADVAVRNVGCNELRAFVACVLEHFEGLASDDLLEHWWTVQELKNPALVGGRVFWPHQVHQSKGAPRDA